MNFNIVFAIICFTTLLNLICGQDVPQRVQPRLLPNFSRKQPPAGPFLRQQAIPERRSDLASEILRVLLGLGKCSDQQCCCGQKCCSSQKGCCGKKCCSGQQRCCGQQGCCGQRDCSGQQGCCCCR